jgi:dihydrofolate reductase
VLTRSGRAPFEGMETFATLAQALDAVRDAPEACVIGGGAVFAETLPLATRMHLTWVDTRVEGADAWFPRFDPGEWRETAREAHPADVRNDHPYAFVDYARRG